MRLETLSQTHDLTLFATLAAEYLDLNVKRNSAESHSNRHYSLIDKFLNELIWMARVLRYGRESIPEVKAE
jgi:hypothetical protein